MTFGDLVRKGVKGLFSKDSDREPMSFEESQGLVTRDKALMTQMRIRRRQLDMEQKKRLIAQNQAFQRSQSRIALMGDKAPRSGVKRKRVYVGKIKL